MAEQKKRKKKKQVKWIGILKRNFMATPLFSIPDMAAVKVRLKTKSWKKAKARERGGSEKEEQTNRPFSSENSKSKWMLHAFFLFQNH